MESFQKARLTYRGPRTAYLTPGLTRQWSFLYLLSTYVWVELGNHQALLVTAQEFTARWVASERPEERH